MPLSDAEAAERSNVRKGLEVEGVDSTCMRDSCTLLGDKMVSQSSKVSINTVVDVESVLCRRG